MVLHPWARLDLLMAPLHAVRSRPCRRAGIKGTLAACGAFAAVGSLVAASDVIEGYPSPPGRRSATRSPPRSCSDRPRAAPAPDRARGAVPGRARRHRPGALQRVRAARRPRGRSRDGRRDRRLRPGRARAGGPADRAPQAVVRSGRRRGPRRRRRRRRRVLRRRAHRGRRGLRARRARVRGGVLPARGAGARAARAARGLRLRVRVAVPLLAAWALAVDGAALPTPTTAEALALVYLAVGVTTGGFLLWYSSIRLLGVERAGLFAGVLPISALALLGGDRRGGDHARPPARGHRRRRRRDTAGCASAALPGPPPIWQCSPRDSRPCPRPRPFSCSRSPPCC